MRHFFSALLALILLASGASVAHANTVGRSCYYTIMGVPAGITAPAGCDPGEYCAETVVDGNKKFTCQLPSQKAATPQPAVPPSSPTGSLQSPGGNTGGITQSPGGNTGGNVTLVNPLGTSDLMTFLQKVLQFVVYLGSIVVIVMLVYVGFLFVAARGEPGKLTEARQALLWTIIGALILLGAQVIASGIAATVQALSVGK